MDSGEGMEHRMCGGMGEENQPGDAWEQGIPGRERCRAHTAWGARGARGAAGAYRLSPEGKGRQGARGSDGRGHPRGSLAPPGELWAIA